MIGTGVNGNGTRNVVLTMTALLLLGTIYTVVGGMLSVLVTDFLQFLVMSVGLIAVTILILTRRSAGTPWCYRSGHYGPARLRAVDSPGNGMAVCAVQWLEMLACQLTWQTTISRVLAAKDAKTGREIYTRTSFFFVCRWLIPGSGASPPWPYSPAAALAACPGHSPGEDHAVCHADISEPVRARGLMGLLLAAMLAADMSTTSSYMITWASVIYNDILAPFRKTRWSERRGLFWNRVIIALIGVFLLFFGLLYPLKGDVWTLPDGDQHDLPGQHLDPADRLLLLEAGEQLGRSRGIVVGAAIPIAFLVFHICTPPRSLPSGSDRVGRDHRLRSARGGDDRRFAVETAFQAARGVES